MGFNFSRPQYDYFERRRPSEYFRVCDPYDCFCGGPRHFKQRNVAVHRTSGGREYYRDPMDFMDDMFDGFGNGYGNGMPGMAMGGFPMAMPPLLGGMGVPPGIGGMGLTPAFGNLPALNLGGNQGQPQQGWGGATTWPPEWKDPREWTTRDYDRLGEIMDEYLNRQRGRGMPSPGNQQMSPFGPPFSPFGPLSPMDSPWDSGRRGGRSRPSHSDLEQLRAQMFAYAQEAKEHMQSTNDFLYGSEREQREERYKERQRKMIEDILRGLTGAGRMNDPAVLGPQNAQPGFPGAGFPGMGMPPGAGFNPMPGFPMPGMQPMFPPGMEGANPFGGMDGFPQRPGFQRQKRARGLGFGDEFGGHGGFGDEFGGRRNRRHRSRFDDDDDMLDMGDGRRLPNDPNDPRQPRHDRGGSGAVFDDQRQRAGEQSHGAASSKWAAYEPSRPEQSRYEASPPRPTASYPDAAAQGAWPGYSNTEAGRYTYVPPRYTGHAHGERTPSNTTRPHVSFQETENAAERPDARNDR